MPSTKARDARPRVKDRAGSELAGREAKLQAALVALRDSLIEVGSAWMVRRRTATVRGVPRMTIGLEPVYAPITTAGLLSALAKHDIQPRPIKVLDGIAVRAVHEPSGVELDLAIARALSKRTEKHLDKTLGRGWRKRGPR